jgi:hypothetical protein
MMKRKQTKELKNKNLSGYTRYITGAYTREATHFNSLSYDPS